MLDARELATLVNAMREAQKQYFRSSTLSNLEAAKRVEREVDREVREILTSLPLFPEDQADERSGS
jgi:cell fate (sporulation/competence/biofilm development) regulator YmcA (YheA/YmcA/DUF963 family)